MQKYRTKQRAALLSFFEDHSDQALSVQQIAEALEQKHISRSAVYRNLAEMEGDGEIRKSSKVGTTRAFFQYMGKESCKNTLHLSCKRCGKTVHMDKDLANRFEELLMTTEGFSLDKANTILYGLCEECRRK